MFKSAFKVTFGVVFGFLFAVGLGILIDSVLVYFADKILMNDADFREWKERRNGDSVQGEKVVTEDSLITDLGLSKEALNELHTNRLFSSTFVWHITGHSRRFFEVSGVSEAVLDEVQERLREYGFDFAKEDE